MLQQQFIILCDVVKRILGSTTEWQTCAEVTKRVIQCDVFDFDDLETYRTFYFASTSEKNSMVRSALRSLCKPPAGRIYAEKSNDKPATYRLLNTRYIT